MGSSSKEAAASQPDLFSAFDSAQPWSAALYKALDGPSRLAVQRTSQRCGQFLVEEAEEFSFTLLAYEGIRYVDWRWRLTQAEAALAARGQGRKTALNIRHPTPYPTALDCIRSIAYPARQAVTQLDVELGDGDSPGPDGLGTPVLRGLATAFPNLRILLLSNVCGCLPAPAALPHLEELVVRPHRNVPSASQAQGSPCSVRDLWASVAAYTAQLTVLIMVSCENNVPWPQLFKGTTTTLTHLNIDAVLSDSLLTLLHTHAPNLAKLTCEWPTVPFAQTHAEATWGLKQVLLPPLELHASVLASLPQTTERLSIGPELSDVKIKLVFRVAGAEGLADTIVQRMPRWHITAPCRVRLDIPSSMEPQDLRTGIGAALQQLTTLPQGTIVQLQCDDISDIRVAVAAVAAAAPALPHLTIRPPKVPGFSNMVAILCQPQHAVAHASIRRMFLGRTSPLASLPWPWQSLYLGGKTAVEQLLYLPDPTGGQFDIEVKHLSTFDQVTDEQRTKLQTRLQHWTFVLRHKTYITLYAPGGGGLEPARQPAALRHMLQLLADFRWRREPGSEDEPITVQLVNWTLTPELLTELRGLPNFPFSAQLTLEDCSWLRTGQCDYEQLPAVIPRCYTMWFMYAYRGSSKKQYSADHLMAICRGASARGEGSEKLRLIVTYYTGQLTDATRSSVERCIDVQGLGRWVGEIKWTCDDVDLFN